MSSEPDDRFEPPGLEHLLKSVKGKRSPGPDFELVPENARPARRFSVKRVVLLLLACWAALVLALVFARIIVPF
jgi:hypothetical protein